jgi:hypothetical protein
MSTIFFEIFCIFFYTVHIFSYFFTSFRLTFKVYDVLPARISETVGFAGLVKCGGAKCHKGLKARLAFCGTRAAEQAA